jgi:hypothetical protein
VKDNAHFYWPPSVVKEHLAQRLGGRCVEAHLRRSGVSVSTVEQLDGGCMLYWLARESTSIVPKAAMKSAERAVVGATKEKR